MTMKSIHQDANSGRALEKQDDLTGIYNSMFEKAFECCIFINHYAKKGFFGAIKQHPTSNMVPHITLIGKLLSFNALNKVTKYKDEFSNLKKDLNSALNKNTNYVTNKIHGIVNDAHQGVDMLSTCLSICIYTGT